MIGRNNGVVAGRNGGISRGKARAQMVMPNPPPLPQPDGDVSPGMIAFKNASLALAEPSHAGMAMDPAMQEEMVLATGTLAPRAGATFIAVQNGNWTAATTWLNLSDAFAVPGAGAKILIPQGITVTFDNNTTTAYDWLRLDGTLTYVRNANTQLYIDTIICGHSSVWDQGTVASPIPAAYTSTTVFPDNGNLNPAVDTLLLGRGFISMGDVFIHGAVKTPFVECHQTRVVGDSTLTLNSAPSGWNNGDEIGITGTSFDMQRVGRKVDYTTVGGLTGTALTLGSVLVWPRSLETIRSDPDFADAVYWVANFTRNITFRSPPGTAIHRRGHWMAMHQTVDVRYAAFDLLGRTDKSVRTWDATDDVRRIEVMGSDIPWNADFPVRGRYNFHLHKAGSAPGSTFANVVGCAASDAPGWLYAHHSSFANFTSCVGRRFSGAGLMAEAGDEVGRWDGNLMMDGQAPQDPTAWWFSEKNNTDIVLQDFGRLAAAYWFRGRVPELFNSIASDCSTGAVWIHRNSNTHPSPLNTQFPIIFYGENAVIVDKPVIISENVKFSCVANGITVVKASPSQGHGFRSRFHNYLMINAENGQFLDYTSKYTMSSWRIRLNNPTTTTVSRGRNGLLWTNGTIDMALQDSVLSGAFNKGVVIVSGNEGTSGIDWNHTIVNLKADPAITTRVQNDGPFVLGTGDNRVVELTSAEVEVRPLTWVPASEPAWNYSHLEVGGLRARHYNLSGDLTDSTQIRNRTYAGVSTSLSFSQVPNLLNTNGYYTYTHPTHGASIYTLVPDVIVDRLMDGGGEYQLRYLTIPLRLVSFTPWDLKNIANNGALPQRYVDAITHGRTGTPVGGSAPWIVYEAFPEGQG